ncbi:RagB/SusD family nutrient uptake outer membrane protein, partial [Xylanibacter rodentium]
VNEVNKRSIALATLTDADTLKFSTYSNKAAMEELVLAERLRELCFEGKRYFDLLRYNYRHVDGVQPDKILADINEDPDVMVENNGSMMNLMTRGMSVGGGAARLLMHTEPYLYFPVLESELKANLLLKQNPAYKKSNLYDKN